MKPTKSRKPLETKAEKEAAAKRAFFRISNPLPIIKECTFEQQSDYVMIHAADNRLISVYNWKKRRFVNTEQVGKDVFLDAYIDDHM